jgi:hypothetical protein
MRATMPRITRPPLHVASTSAGEGEFRVAYGGWVGRSPYIEIRIEEDGSLLIRGSESLNLRGKADNLVQVWLEE